MAEMIGSFADEKPGTKDEEIRKRAFDTLHNHLDALSFIYEKAMGVSFHNSPARKGQPLKREQLLHEHRLALKARISAGMRVLEAGCGVGGPVREIAFLTGARVTGLNISKYEIERARQITKKEEMEHLCDFVEASFDEMPFEECTFDRVITMESIIHAKDKKVVFNEIYRVLKPGGMYLSHYWALTDKYDDSIPEHRRIARDIIVSTVGTGLYGLSTVSMVKQQLRDCGFIIKEFGDFRDISQRHWTDFSEQVGSQGFLSSWLGEKIVVSIACVLEILRLIPKGCRQIMTITEVGQAAMIRGGKMGIISPMAFVLAQKPER